MRDLDIFNPSEPVTIFSQKAIFDDQRFAMNSIEYWAWVANVWKLNAELAKVK